MNKIIKNIITIILSIIIIICLIIIIDKNYKYYKSDKTYQDIRLISNDLKDNILMENKLKEINSEYKFWINVTTTEIDYPVVQASDNEFYLKNNFNKENDIGGSIFLDYNNNLEEDKNLIVYGHNMRNGSMFAAINKFKEKDYFDTGVINIIKDGNNYSYEIFSVFIEKSNEINLKNSFNNQEEFYEYINNVKEKSMYYKDINNSDISNIITLYTCSYEFDEARTIVCASLTK
ncbi:class B sortase [Clostridioides difficile]